MLNPNVNPKPKLKPKSRMIKSGSNFKSFDKNELSTLKYII